MGVDERSWRRECYRGWGSKPVWNPKTKHYEYGEYDPDGAQADANEKAAQKGPRQKLLNRIADEFKDLVCEKNRHRSLYDARCILLERHTGLHPTHPFGILAAKEIQPMTESLSATVKTADRKAEKHVPVITSPAARIRITLSHPGTLHATAYCNLHGLWTSTVPITVK